METIDRRMLTEESYTAGLLTVKDREAWFAAWFAARHAERLKAYPIDLRFIRAVTYDTKSDRYVGTFANLNNEGKDSVKLTPEVAEYLLKNKHHPDERTGAPRLVEVLARMENGAVVDVSLMVY